MLKGSLQIKKNNKYYVYVRIDGKQKAIPTGIEAVRGSKRRAEAKMIEILAELDDNPHIYDKVLFVDYAMKWLEYNQKQVDIITFTANKKQLEQHIIPYFKPLKLYLQNVKASDIEGYYNHKAVTGRMDGKPGGLSKGSLKRHCSVMSCIFNMALHDDLIKKNPCEHAKLPNIETVPQEINIYTAEQCKRLLEVTKGELFHDMVYITFIYGLRRSELMGLRWRDVDFENNTITISHTAVATGIMVRKDKTKTSSSHRTYPLLDDIRDMLLDIKNQQTHYKAIFGNGYTDTGYVFTKEDGTAYYPDYPTKKLKKVIKKFDLPYIKFHELRKSCVTMLIEKGWNMKDVSDWVGHSDISVTMNIYAQVTMSRKRELADGLTGTLLQ